MAVPRNVNKTLLNITINMSMFTPETNIMNPITTSVTTTILMKPCSPRYFRNSLFLKIVQTLKHPFRMDMHNKNMFPQFLSLPPKLPNQSTEFP